MDEITIEQFCGNLSNLREEFAAFVERQTGNIESAIEPVWESLFSDFVTELWGDDDLDALPF